MEKKLYTILIYSENVVGVLNLVTAVFTRNQVNIESLNVSPSGIPNVHKYTVTVFSDESQAKKLVKQIERKVDVIKANFYVEDEIFVSEVALFKISTPTILSNPEISRFVRHSGAKILEMNETYTTMQLCVKPDAVTDLYKKLAKFKCVLQYTRSGVVAITRNKIEKVSEFLKEQENQQFVFLEEGINSEDC